MRTRIAALVIAAASMALVAVAPTAGAQGGWQVKPCNGDGTMRATPTHIWPPNHKMHSVTLAYTESENDGDTIGFEVMSITNNEQGREKGKMLKDNPDATGVGSRATGVDLAPDNPIADEEVAVRSERLGSDKAGRVYSITVKCTDAGDVSGNPPRSDTVVMTVRVPHDRSHNHHRHHH